MIRGSGRRLTYTAAILSGVAAGALELAYPTGRLRAFTDQFPLCVGATQASDADERAFLAAAATAMTTMMAAVSVEPARDIDGDFVSMMVPHHQSAIDMAQAELRYGRNERLRRMAQEIIVTQQQEIAAMRMAIGQPLRPSVPALDQVVSAEPKDSTPPQPADRQGALK